MAEITDAEVLSNEIQKLEGIISKIDEALVATQHDLRVTKMVKEVLEESLANRPQQELMDILGIPEVVELASPEAPVEDTDN